MMLNRNRRHWRNRSGSVQARPNHYSSPVSFEEIQSEVLRAAEEGQRLRVAGSGRASSPLCWTDENLMSLHRYEGIERWAPDRSRVWVRSGTTMGALAAELARHGLALENWQGPRSHTLGGAITTGAHSSSLRHPCLSAQVSGIHLVCADGSARTFSADSNAHLLDAVRLSLGALGVITHVELRCVPAYRLLRRSELTRLDDLLRKLPRQLQDHAGFSFRWFPYTGVVESLGYAHTELAAAPRRALRDAQRAAVLGARHWLLEQASQRLPTAALRLQRYTPAPPASAHSVLAACDAAPPALQLPSHELEYALPLARLEPALAQMERVIRALKFSAHLPIEVRFSKADTLWLSPASGRDSACITLRVPQSAAFQDYFAAMTEIADRHDGRPGWGSLHGKTVRELAPLYERYEDFLGLRHQLDPRGVFLNPHLSALFGVRET